MFTFPKPSNWPTPPKNKVSFRAIWTYFESSLPGTKKKRHWRLTIACHHSTLKFPRQKKNTKTALTFKWTFPACAFRFVSAGGVDALWSLSNPHHNLSGATPAVRNSLLHGSSNSQGFVGGLSLRLIWRVMALLDEVRGNEILGNLA